MPLEAGARLGAYEIVGSLGAGGMGEVYKARDTRLDRFVAVKVVRDGLGADPEARDRFEGEARAIAALNHPHICTIHDVGRHEDVEFLVMELLDGRTLADRLNAGPLPMAEALAIAIQIADALDAAHRIGIVHRDLKPGNVVLLRGGPQGGTSAKLLDFGLATTRVRAPAPLDASLAETMAPSLVETRAERAAGSTMLSGTVPYLAPELLEGGTVDHRADIFAFGCVLYELLAGRRAFGGGQTLAVVAAIMKTEPPPVDALRTAPVLDHLLRRCLEKDPERRWQSMGDVAGELRWIASQPPAPWPPAAAGRGRPWLRAAAVPALLLAAALAALAGSRWLAGGEAAPALQLEITTPPTDNASLALSPDGRQVVFVANQDRRPMLWVRSIDRLDSRPVPGTEGASLPFWSPEGTAVGYFAGGRLKRLDLASGASMVLADAPNGRGGTWGPDGTILFSPDVQAPILRVASQGGPVTAVTTPQGRIGHRRPHFLPDGRRFLFSVTLGGPETDGVYLASLAGGAPRRVLPQADGAGLFAPPDRLLVVQQGALVAHPFDADAGAVDGEPTVIARGIGAESGGFGAFSTSGDGVRLAYRAGGGQRRQLAWADRAGLILSSVGEPGGDAIAAPELSPDGQRLTLFLQPRGDNEVGIVDLQRGLARLLTNGPPADAHPIWDPDGRHVVFVSSRVAGNTGPVRAAIDGTGMPAPLFAAPIQGAAVSWTRDRQFVLLRQQDADGRPNLVAVSLDGTRTVPVAATRFDETEGQFSPDGTRVAFVSHETGEAEVYVQSFPAGAGRTQVSAGGGTQVRWAADGREIFYVAPDGWMTAVAVAPDGDGMTASAPQRLFETFLATGTNVVGSKAQYAVARDGRFLLNRIVESPAPPIVVSLDWRRTLDR